LVLYCRVLLTAATVSAAGEHPRGDKAQAAKQLVFKWKNHLNKTKFGLKQGLKLAVQTPELLGNLTL